jgi:hypothetical protein
LKKIKIKGKEYEKQRGRKGEKSKEAEKEEIFPARTDQGLKYSSPLICIRQENTSGSRT